MLVKSFRGYKFIIGFLLLASLFGLAFFVPIMANAQEGGLVGTGPTIAVEDTLNVAETVQNVINYALGFLGLVAVLVIIYGGVLWMTSAGDPKKLEKAKRILINAAIGLLIILSAWVIVKLIFGLFGGRARDRCNVETDTTETCYRSCCPGMPPVAGSRSCQADGYWSTCDASCADIDCGSWGRGGNLNIDWTYPRDGEMNAVPCGLVQVYFSRPLSSAADEAADNFSLISCGADGECPVEAAEIAAVKVAGMAQVTGEARKLFSFVPTEDLLVSTYYRASFNGGDDGVHDSEGRILMGDYSWKFRTGAEMDDIPPTVRKTNPENGASEVCLPLQIVFSEAMDMRTVGADDNFGTNGDVVWDWDAEDIFSASWTPKDNYQISTDYIATAKGNSVARSEWKREHEADITMGMRDVCGNPMARDYSWSFNSGDDISKVPEIYSVEATDAYYSDLLTISGQCLGVTGKVRFSADLNADDKCFDTVAVSDGGRQAYLARGSCFNPPDIWRPTEIQVRVPAGSSGAVNGALKVEVGRRAAVSDEGINILSPHINYISGYNASSNPARGNTDQMMTIAGVNFGTDGRVYFIKNGARIIEAQAPENCGDTWQERQIVVLVPAGLAVGDEIKVQVVADEPADKTLKQRSSNLKDFQFVTAGPGPGICAINDVCDDGGAGGVIDDPRTAIGVNFGATEEKISFGPDGRVDASVEDWSDTAIDTKVPVGVTKGNNPVRVMVAELVSNYFAFSVPCGTYACDSDPTTFSCEPGACQYGFVCGEDCLCVRALSVVDKWPSCNQACVNTAAGVKLNQAIDLSTADNLVVWRCDDESCNTGTVIDGLRNYDEESKSLNFEPGADLEANAWYRAIVGGSIKTNAIETGVNLNLSGLNFNTDGSGNQPYDAYSWKFKTRDSVAPCEVTQVGISPRRFVARAVGVNNNFLATARSASNCGGDPIVSRGLDYEWSSDAPRIGALPTGGCAGPQCRVTVGRDGDGVALIKALVDRIFGTAEFIVDLAEDATLRLVSLDPADGKENVCRNIGIEGMFNLPLRGGMSGNFRLYKLNMAGEPESEIISRLVLESNGKTFHVYPRAGLLDSETRYIVAMRESTADGAGVRAQNGAGLENCGALTREKTIDGESWCVAALTTGGTLCRVDYVRVDPAVESLVFGQGRNYSALAYGNPRVNLSATDCSWGFGDDGLATALPAADNSCQARITAGETAGDTQVKASVITDDGAISCDDGNALPGTCGNLTISAGGGLGDNCSLNGGAREFFGEDVCAMDSGYLPCASELTCSPDTCKCVNGRGLGEPCASEDICRDDNCATSLDLACAGENSDTCTCQYVNPEANIIAPDQCTNGIVNLIFNTLLSKATISSANIHIKAEDGTIFPTLIMAQDIDIDGDRHSDATKVIVSPANNFTPGENYQVVITADVLSAHGVAAIAAELNFRLSDAAYFCRVAGAAFSPNKYEFYKRNETHEFLLIPTAANREELSLIGVTQVNWGADILEQIPDNIISIREINPAIPSPIFPVVEVTAGVTNGSARIAGIFEEILPEAPTNRVVAILPITVFVCENLGKFMYEAPDGSVSESDYFENFGGVEARTRYCLDWGAAGTEDDLPNLVIRAGDAFNDPDFYEQSHWLMAGDGLTGVLGAMSFKNNDYLTPGDWFKVKYGESAGQGSFEVGGYPALREGRSTYVGATDVACAAGCVVDEVGECAGSCGESPRRVMTNMHLLSYSENADSKTQNIYNQLLKNWEFNVGIGQDAKLRMTRDLRRLYDLKSILVRLKNYANQNGNYPKLDGGTYISGQSTSVWPSWGTTFSVELGGNLPKDPINTLGWPGVNTDGTCPPKIDREDPESPVDENFAEYSEVSSGGICLPDGYDAASGWNEVARDFKCPPPASYFYLYKVLDNGNDYGLYANMEYFLPSDFGGRIEAEGIVSDDWPCTGSGCALNFRLGRGGGEVVTPPTPRCNLLVSDGECPGGCSGSNDYDCWLAARPDDWLDRIIDTNVPNVRIARVPDGWTNSAPVIAIECTSPTGGTCNGEGFKEVGAAVTVCPDVFAEYTPGRTLAVVEHKYFCAVARNSRNLSGFSVPTEIKVDRVAPTVSDFKIFDPVTGGRSGGPISVCNNGDAPRLEWTAADAGDSGLKQMEIWRAPWSEGALATLAAGATNWTVPVNIDPGTYTYGVHAMDNAGNCMSESGVCGGGGSTETIDVRIVDCSPRSVTINKTSGGRVISSPPATPSMTCSDGCTSKTGLFAYEITSVVLTAEDTPGWQFDSWSDCPAVSGNECTVDLSSGNVEVGANFVRTWTVMVTAGSGGGVAITKNGAAVANPVVIRNGESLKLTATANTGSTFVNWTAADGATCGCTSNATVNPCNLNNISQNNSCVANFNVTTYTVTASAGAGGRVSPESQPAVQHGHDALPVTAWPNDVCYDFANWTGSCAGQGATCTLRTITADKNSTANFRIKSFSLNVTKPSNGMITGTGISCGTTGNDCSESGNCEVGGQVVLTVRADDGYEFSGWGGCDSVNGSNQCVVNKNGTKNVTANFTREQYELRINTDGAGTVRLSRVASGPTGACTNIGGNNYSCDSNVIMTIAATVTGAGRVEWGGDCAGASGSSCTLTMNGPKIVTINFIGQRSLRLTKTGAGAGKICISASQCQSAAGSTDFAVDNDAVVTVTHGPAVVGGVDKFDSFTDRSSVCQAGGNINICTVQMNSGSDKEVKALFPAEYTVNIKQQAVPTVGIGTISYSSTLDGGTPTVVGLPCSGASCPITFKQFEDIILTARASAGMKLDTWVGDDCTPMSGDRCSINNLDGPKTVTAKFKDGVYPRVNSLSFAGRSERTICLPSVHPFVTIQHTYDDLPEGGTVWTQLYMSNDNGEHWSHPRTVAAGSDMLVVDPRVAPQSYMFGIHVEDEAGNCITEQGKICGSVPEVAPNDGITRTPVEVLRVNVCTEDEICSASGACITLPVGKVVFVTGGTVANSSMQGGKTDGRIRYGSLVGVDAADAICNDLARSGNAIPVSAKPSATNRYKAWLSGVKDGVVYSPKDNFVRSNSLPYFILDGTIVAYNWLDLVTYNAQGRLLPHAVDMTENGESLTDEYAWTGTQWDGTRHWCGLLSGNCGGGENEMVCYDYQCGLNWDNNSPELDVDYPCGNIYTGHSGMGIVNTASAGWTKDAFWEARTMYPDRDINKDNNCDKAFHLYCFQQ